MGLKKYFINMIFKTLYRFEHFNRAYKNYKHYRQVDVLKKSFKKAGNNFRIGKDYFVYHPECIQIGNDFSARDRYRIEAITEYAGEKFNPHIRIGNNVKFLYDIHIGCIDKIEIGDNCLFASRIFISDHDHGNTGKENLSLLPNNRPLYSKGPIIIEENVWVGEGVAILGGVKIGKNSVIATNAVVTKDVPAFSIVGGIPAKIIKSVE